jgi:hypothetical protein
VAALSGEGVSRCFQTRGTRQGRKVNAFVEWLFGEALLGLETRLPQKYEGERRGHRLEEVSTIHDGQLAGNHTRPISRV